MQLISRLRAPQPVGVEELLEVLCLQVAAERDIVVLTFTTHILCRRRRSSRNRALLTAAAVHLSLILIRATQDPVRALLGNRTGDTGALQVLIDQVIERLRLRKRLRFFYFFLLFFLLRWLSFKLRFFCLSLSLGCPNFRTAQVTVLLRSQPSFFAPLK